MVYDVDNKARVDDTRRHDFIGEIECSLADIVTSGQLYKRTLRMKGMYITPCVCELLYYWGMQCKTDLHHDMVTDGFEIPIKRPTSGGANMQSSVRIS